MVECEKVKEGNKRNVGGMRSVRRLKWDYDGS